MYYIYRITNKVNGKTYIGKHKYKCLNDNYMGSGVHLRRAQKKYGMKNFKKEILLFNILKLEHANLLEKAFIEAEREKVGRENCYNISNGGDGSAGFHHTEETKKVISESSKRRHHTEETKRKIAESKKRHVVSEETRKKISEALKGEKNPNYGKHLSEETKRKIGESNSIANKGHTSPNKGKHISEEQKKKISETLKGKHHWYNNGEINVLTNECPEGFVKGRLVWR